jgi:hypothetical protein
MPDLHDGRPSADRKMIRPFGILIAMAALRDIRLLRKARKDKGRTKKLTLNTLRLLIKNCIAELCEL